MNGPTQATVKRLFAVSGNRCAFPGCVNRLIEGTKVTARISHICGQRPGGPRFDETQSDDARHGFDNLLLLCPIHADVVDADVEAYTVERLQKMKRDHECGLSPVPDLSESLAAQLVADSISESVISIGQSGGIVARTVNLDSQPERRLLIREMLASRPDGDVFHTQLELTVETSQPAANLALHVEAPSVQRIKLTPPPSGLVSMTQDVQPGHAYASLQHPFGVLMLDIFTTTPESIKLHWEFQ